jgi:hypothetical protein
LFVGLALTSCSDDNETTGPTPDAAAVTGDSGSVDVPGLADAAASLMCKALSRPLTRAELTPLVTSGMCMAASDLDTVCANDVVTITKNCAGINYLALKGDAGADFQVDIAMLKAKTTTCVRTLLASAAISDGCLGCFGDATICGLAKCANMCLPDPTVPACGECLNTSGCSDNFYTCTGLPPPLPSDGGVSDAAPTGDAAVDAAPTSDAAVDTAATVDAAPADAGAGG